MTGGMNPRLRQRVETVSVRATLKPGTTNTELFEAWKRSAKVAPSTLKSYASAIGDALRFFTTPEGQERPVRTWTKADVWEWIHFNEANYCRHFQQIHVQQPVQAKCKAKVWAGTLPADEAAQAHCGGCPLFLSLAGSTIAHKLHALDKWFGYLARMGAIQVNFMGDLMEEWYEENPKTDNGSEEKKRNPTHDEARRMVNETTHPMHRALYACSFKWWTRPNETLSLDRYASLGLPMPRGHKMPPGFKSGFLSHPEVESFEAGGGLVYVPEKVDEAGQPRREKRSGNRWLVVDAELRPILEQYLAWWERTVQRNDDGTPKTTALWLTDLGTGVELDAVRGVPSDWNERTWYADAERLGIMQPGDREDPERRLAGHCARHYGQKKCQEEKVHPDWNKHFRGDAFQDARGAYYKPEPLEVLREYLQQVRPIGLKPLPEAPRLRKAPSEAETHRGILQAERERTKTAYRRRLRLTCARITVQGEAEAWIVPQRVSPSVAFALRVARPGLVVHVEQERGPRLVFARDLLPIYEKAAGMLT